MKVLVTGGTDFVSSQVVGLSLEKVYKLEMTA